MKKYFLSFLLILIIFANTACDAANAPRPKFELYSQNFNGGNPEIWITITPNGQTLQDIRIEWGRNSVETQPPLLHATSGLNELESAIFIDASNNNIINQPIQEFKEPFRLYVKFGLTDLMDANEVLVYKVRTTHQIKDDQGENDILYTWSEQFTIDHETFPAGGGNGNGGGIILGETCLDPIPIPTVIEPQNGATCVGDLGPRGSNLVTVSLRWDAVEGIAKHDQAYQVEIRTSSDISSCVRAWQEGEPNFYNSELDCSISDINSPLWSENFPPNTTYQWRVRATCLEEDGELIPGEFPSNWLTFTTADQNCQNQ